MLILWVVNVSPKPLLMNIHFYINLNISLTLKALNTFMAITVVIFKLVYFLNKLSK